MKKLLLLFLLIPSILWAAPPARIYSNTTGEIIDPSKVTSNEDAVFNYLTRGVDTLADNAVTTEKILNGTITTSDISGTAGIVDTQLATISTAGKVSGAAFTGLASIPSGAGVIPAANVPTTVAGSDTQIQFNDGSALAGTSTLTWNKTIGSLSNTTQPAFSATVDGNQANIAAGSAITVVFATEIFDQGSDFATNTFTAPVTGKYQLNFTITLKQCDSATTLISLGIITSNNSYYQQIYPSVNIVADGGMYGTVSVLADMDVNDTAYCVVNQADGASQIDIESPAVNFSGFLAN